MAAYQEYIQILRETFEAFELVHVPREQNPRGDLLAKLASLGKGADRGQSFRRPRGHLKLPQIIQQKSSRSALRKR